MRISHIFIAALLGAVNSIAITSESAVTASTTSEATAKGASCQTDSNAVMLYSNKNLSMNSKKWS